MSFLLAGADDLVESLVDLRVEVDDVLKVLDLVDGHLDAIDDCVGQAQRRRAQDVVHVRVLVVPQVPRHVLQHHLAVSQT